MKYSNSLVLVTLIGCLHHILGFVVPVTVNPMIGSARQRPAAGTSTWNPATGTHPALIQQRHSVAKIQTQGLFGLGGPEIAIIVVVAAFLIGPQNLGSMIGQMKAGLDEVPDELKKIPEEFKKGIDEGETNARARNAKKMDSPPSLEQEKE